MNVRPRAGGALNPAVQLSGIDPLGAIPRVRPMRRTVVAVGWMLVWTLAWGGAILGFARRGNAEAVPPDLAQRHAAPAGRVGHAPGH
jgi:hypothetical protein